MKVILCHNYFRERGGEDQVFEDELDLLETHGVEVIPFVKNNRDFDGFWDTTKIAFGTPWNRSSARELTDLVDKTGADVVHFHNWLPQISPAAFHAARRAGAVVIQTLHNYRWACPKGILFRDGDVCEKCVGKTVPWPAVRHSCYRGSVAGSTFIAGALALHNMLDTKERMIDSYIAPGTFIREKMASAGVPGDRIFIKPNFLTTDPGPGTGDGGYMVSLGRLSPEKKIDTLLGAWELLDGQIPLKISGSGVMRPLVEAAAAKDASIEYLGFAPDEALDGLLGNARGLVFTSGTYEAQPMAILETYAKGTPVIAARMGAMTDLIEDGVTGFHFAPGDREDLARVVRHVFNPSTDLGPIRQSTRDKYLTNYTPAPNFDRLMEIYELSIKRRRADQQENQ
jgi:glycosyltransferase involved in cell wall biosynthesis